MNHQEDYVQLQLLNQQVQQLEESINNAQVQMEHGVVATQVLESFSTATPEQELLVPVGSGAFLEVKAKDVKNVKLAVGSQILVDSSIEDTLKKVKSQLQELQQYQEQSITLYQQVVQKINILQEQIEQKMKQ